MSGFSWQRWGSALDLLKGLAGKCSGDAEAMRAFRERLPKLLTERAELSGMSSEELWGRESAVAVGGSCQMLQSVDGWVAVNLPRDADWDLLPAWFVLSGVGSVAKEFGWKEVDEGVASASGVRLVEAAAELGLAVARVGEYEAVVRQDVVADKDADFSAIPLATKPLSSAKVLDISSMWAGPLCGNLLGTLGAKIVKLECQMRPDGTRSGQTEFFQLLNQKKSHHSFNFRTTEGRARLRQHLREADIVIASSRLRALEQLGICPQEFVGEHGCIWLQISGYGMAEGSDMRVAFGDDAAAAAGLVKWSEAKQLSFIGDAIADPITGVVATIEVLKHWLCDLPAVLDISMVKSAAEFAQGS